MNRAPSRPKQQESSAGLEKSRQKGQPPRKPKVPRKHLSVAFAFCAPRRGSGTQVSLSRGGRAGSHSLPRLHLRGSDDEDDNHNNMLTLIIHGTLPTHQKKVVAVAFLWTGGERTYFSHQIMESKLFRDRNTPGRESSRKARALLPSQEDL